MDVTKEGEQLIKRWKYATEQKADLKRRLNKAECELKNAEIALADWLLPKDAVANEKFCVWCGDSLVASVHVNGVGSVKLRTRGPGWDKL